MSLFVVNVDLTAQERATANTPVLTDNTIAGAVTINYNNTAGNGTVTITVLTETHCLLAVSEIMLSNCEPYSYLSSCKN